MARRVAARRVAFCGVAARCVVSCGVALLRAAFRRATFCGAVACSLLAGWPAGAVAQGRGGAISAAIAEPPSAQALEARGTRPLCAHAYAFAAPLPAPRRLLGEDRTAVDPRLREAVDLSQGALLRAEPEQALAALRSLGALSRALARRPLAEPDRRARDAALWNEALARALRDDPRGARAVWEALERLAVSEEVRDQAALQAMEAAARAGDLAAADRIAAAIAAAAPVEANASAASASAEAHLRAAVRRVAFADAATHLPAREREARVRDRLDEVIAIALARVGASAQSGDAGAGAGASAQPGDAGAGAILVRAVLELAARRRADERMAAIDGIAAAPDVAAATEALAALARTASLNPADLALQSPAASALLGVEPGAALLEATRVGVALETLQALHAARLPPRLAPSLGATPGTSPAPAARSAAEERFGAAVDQHVHAIECELARAVAGLVRSGAEGPAAPVLARARMRVDPTLFAACGVLPSAASPSYALPTPPRCLPPRYDLAAALAGSASSAASRGARLLAARDAASPAARYALRLAGADEGARALALLGLSLAEERAGDLDAARAALARAAARAPADPLVASALAEAALARGDVGAAREALAPARSTGLSDSAYRLTAARVELTAGRPEAAVAHVRVARARDPFAIRPRLCEAEIVAALATPAPGAVVLPALDGLPSPESLLAALRTTLLGPAGLGLDASERAAGTVMIALLQSALARRARWAPEAAAEVDAPPAPP